MRRLLTVYVAPAVVGLLVGQGVLHVWHLVEERVRGPRICEAPRVEEVPIERGNATWPGWRLVCDRYAE